MFESVEESCFPVGLGEQELRWDWSKLAVENDHDEDLLPPELLHFRVGVMESLELFHKYPSLGVKVVRQIVALALMEEVAVGEGLNVAV